MNKVTILIAACVFISIAYFLSVHSQEIGSKCEIIKNGEKGICTIFSKCLSAIYNLKVKNVRPQGCQGFFNKDPVVCCVKKRGDMSNSKCLEYLKHVYKKVDPPTFLSGSKIVLKSTCHNAQPLIAGGKKAVEKEFPHMALAGIDGGSTGRIWICGGSLISEWFVLTAAHCKYSYQENKMIKYVRFGVLNFNEVETTVQEYEIKEVIQHQNYTHKSSFHDIALLKLNRFVHFNEFIRPACLHVRKNIRNEESDGIISGWGEQNLNQFRSGHLMKAVVKIVDHDICLKNQTLILKLKDGINEEMQLCAGTSDGSNDTCPGDSGGPLQRQREKMHCMYDIIGITSCGQACGSKVPSIYTRVSYYINWIEEHVWNQTHEQPDDESKKIPREEL